MQRRREEAGPSLCSVLGAPLRGEERKRKRRGCAGETAQVVVVRDTSAWRGGMLGCECRFGKDGAGQGGGGWFSR